MLSYLTVLVYTKFTSVSVASGGYLSRRQRGLGKFLPLATSTSVNNCYVYYFLTENEVNTGKCQTEAMTTSRLIFLDGFFFDNEKLCTWACDQLKTNNGSADNLKKKNKSPQLHVACNCLWYGWRVSLQKRTTANSSFSFLNKCLISHWFKRSGWTVDDHRTHGFVTSKVFQFFCCFYYM